MVASNEISFLPGFGCEQGAYMSASISPCDYDKSNRIANISNNHLETSNDLEKGNYLAYPNPTPDVFKITNLSDFSGAYLNVYSILGIKLFTQKIVDGEELIDLRSYKNGIYLIKIDGLNNPIRISKE